MFIHFSNVNRCYLFFFIFTAASDEEEEEEFADESQAFKNIEYLFYVRHYFIIILWNILGCERFQETKIGIDHFILLALFPLLLIAWWSDQRWSFSASWNHQNQNFARQKSNPKLYV